MDVVSSGHTHARMADETAGAALEKVRSSLGDDKLSGEMLPFQGEGGPMMQTFHLKDRDRYRL